MRRAPGQERLALPDGRRVGFRNWEGEGVPVVLLHGLLDSSAGWDRLCVGTARHCLAVDLPGFGSSDMPSRARLSAYADDILATMDRLALARAVLVGHSIGGGVAAALADRDPERVAGLVLLAPAGFGRIPLAEAVSIPGLRSLVARCLPLALANPLLLTAAYTSVVTSGQLPDGQLVQRVMQNAFRATPGAVAGTQAVVAAGLSKHGMHHRRSRYSGAAHVLWGGRDRLVPRGHLDGVRHALPQAHIEIWEGMGHHPQREREAELAAFVDVAVALTDVERPPAERAA